MSLHECSTKDYRVRRTLQEATFSVDDPKFTKRRDGSEKILSVDEKYGRGDSWVHLTKNPDRATKIRGFSEKSW